VKTNYHRRANITLAAVFLFFLGAAVLEHFNPGHFGIRLMFFVSEAALVGGIADWFAVTAIFKKPLGWGYHTALIPRNREKVIEAVASIVQTELLNMTLIRKKIEGIPFIEGLLLSVEKVGGSIYLRKTGTGPIGRETSRVYPLHSEDLELGAKGAGYKRMGFKTRIYRSWTGLLSRRALG